jgi:hypothetical protein
MKKIPPKLREAALEELQKFQRSIQNLSETWDIPARLLFDFVGLAAPSTKDSKRFNKWLEYQHKNFNAAVEEARCRSVSATPLDTLSVSATSLNTLETITFPEPFTNTPFSTTPDASSSTTPDGSSTMVFPSKKPLLAGAVGILSEWYKKRTAEEDLQLEQDVAEELQLRKEKVGYKWNRNTTSRIPADPKCIKVDSQRTADTHVQHIHTHLNALHTGFGIHSLLVTVGGGYHSMMAGTLTHPNLPYMKLFGKLVMPLHEFQNKLESAVMMGELVEQGGFGDNIKVTIKDTSKDNKVKPAQEARVKDLGDKLRAIFSKCKH